MSKYQSAVEANQSLDQAVLIRLRADMGEDVQMVIDAYLQSIGELLSELKNRSVDDSGKDISRRAHSIKSSSAAIGMMKLSAIAANLERALNVGEPIDVDKLVSQIDIEFNHSRNLLDR